MKKIILILICISLLIIDNSIIPFFAIKGVFGSSLFVFSLAISINSNKWDALTVGVISGLLQDIFFANVIGINSLVNMFLCLGCSILGESIFKNKSIIPVVISFVATLIKYILIYLIGYFINMDISMNGIKIMCIYNVFIMFVIYKQVYKFANKDIMKEPWSFYK